LTLGELGNLLQTQTHTANSKHAGQWGWPAGS
jgi:hypothetical protein